MKKTDARSSEQYSATLKTLDKVSGALSELKVQLLGDNTVLGHKRESDYKKVRSEIEYFEETLGSVFATVIRRARDEEGVSITVRDAE